MDQQQLFNLIIGIAISVGGWFCRLVWAEMKTLQREHQRTNERISTINQNMAENYVRYKDFDIAMNRMFNTLDRIEEKLDKKVDK